MVATSASPFTAESVLTSLEKSLVAAVERGDAFKPPSEQLRRSAKLRGGLIRAMLLRTPLKHHPRRGAGESLPVSVTPHGIRIVGPADAEPPRPPAAGPSGGPPQLHIVGPLELGGLAASDGGFLPPIEFSHCLVEQPIDLSGTNLQSLRLEKSRFSRLRAVNARFNGGVFLINCGPRRETENQLEREFLSRTVVAVHKSTHEYRFQEDHPIATTAATATAACPCRVCAAAPQAWDELDYEGNCDFCCDIDFEAAEIGGFLEVSRTYLRAAKIVGRDYVTPRITDRFAAFLDGIKVGGSIIFERSVFVGRCSLRNADVSDDFWVAGGKFVSSVERPTFDFQFASIGGLLLFRAFDALKPAEAADGIRALPVVVIGQISGISMRAGEIQIAEGFHFGYDPLRRGGHATINFGKCDVGRTFKVGTYHEFQDPDRPTGGAWIHGEVCLTAANLGKNLEVHGADYEGLYETLGLNHGFYDYLGVNLNRETPHLRLSGHGLKVDRRAYISKGRFRDADPLRSGRPRSRKPSAIDLWKSTIGTGLRIEAGTSCIGAIRLNNCVIGREANIRCSKVEASPEERRRRQLRRRIPCLIDISESTIDGHVKIGQLLAPPTPQARSRTRRAATQEAPRSALRVEGGISLRSTRVQGGILIGHVMVDLSRRLASTPPGDAPAGAEEKQGAAVICESPEEAEPVQLRAVADSEDARIAIDLRGCDCGSDLEVRQLRWQLPAPTPSELPRRPNGPPVVYSPVISGSPAAVSHSLSAATGSPAGIAASTAVRRPEPDSRAFGVFTSPVGAALGLSRFRHIHEGFFAIVDLRGLRCATLLDGFGAEWGLVYRIQLRIAGIKVTDVEPVCHPAGPRRRPELPRLRWLAHQHTVQRAPRHAGTPAGGEMRIRFAERLVSTWRDDFVPHTYQTFSSAYRRAGEDLTADRILVEKKDTQNALYFWRLFRVWYSRRWWFSKGWSSFRRLILVAAVVMLFVYGQLGPAFQNLDYRFMSWRLFGLAAAVFVLWPFVTAAFQMLFKWMFLYGLSAERGLLVFSVAIGIGWAAVHDWRYGGLEIVTDWTRRVEGGIVDPSIVLVLAASPEPGDASPGAAGAPGPFHRVDIADGRAVGTRMETKPVVARATPCNADVSSLLYALDTFLPLIDLDQERRCEIRSALPGEPTDRYLAYRIMKALYELAGWLVTSLLILTVTGVLRRDLER